MRFEIGDRVQILVDHPYENPDIVSGDIGTVCEVVGGIVGVRFDYRISGGHTCDGNCEDGYGWQMFVRELELCEEDDEANDIDNNSFMNIIGGIA